MPRVHPPIAPTDITSPDPQQSASAPRAAEPKAPRADAPLPWTLEGALRPGQRRGRGDGERRGGPAPQRSHPAVDARRRRSPSSRFRG